MSKKENHQQWSKKIAEFKKSEKTKEEWCKKKNITKKQFNYWLRQFPEENTETQWLPIKIKEENRNLALNLKIGEVSIEVCPGYDKEFLLEILTTLKSL